MAEHRTGLGGRLADDDRYARLDDAGFFAGYFGERVAQELYMVKADVGDDAKVGRDDVRAVQPSAQPHFDDRHLHLLLLEIPEGHGGGQFEERGMERLEKRPMPLYELRDVGLRDGLPVDADALAEIH